MSSFMTSHDMEPQLWRHCYFPALSKHSSNVLLPSQQSKPVYSVLNDMRQRKAAHDFDDEIMTNEKLKIKELLG